jgi:hypothetical protein
VSDPFLFRFTRNHDPALLVPFAWHFYLLEG